MYAPRRPTTRQVSENFTTVLAEGEPVLAWRVSPGASSAVEPRQLAALHRGAERLLVKSESQYHCSVASTSLT